VSDADDQLASRLAAIRARIDAAARSAGRDPREVTLVGASKTQPAEVCAAAVRAGCNDLGENRAQELLAKAPVLADDVTTASAVRWHFIGQLQRNKVRALAPWVQLWHSVDREPLAAEIARHQPGARVLIEVSVAGEAQKGGVALGALDALIDACRALDLRVEGLMTVPPLGVDPRPTFATLREAAADRGLTALSMGMTEDFEDAIAEGATIVRVGRAIFGDRGSHRGVGLPG